MTQEAPIGRGALAAAAGTGLSRATGFLRIAAMAYALGVAENRLADTYNLANSTPNIVFELVLGGILSSVIMRVYIEVRDREGADEGWRFITRLLNVSVLLLAVITLLAVVVAPLILGLYTAGSRSGDVELRRQVGTFLLRLFAFQIVFYGLGQISTAVLEAHRRFGVVMFAPVLNNVFVTGVFIAFAAMVPESLRDLGSVPPSGLLLLGLGTTAGVMLLGLAPFLYMRAVGYRRVKRAGFSDPRFRRLAKLSAYQLGYVVTNQAGLWVALKLAFDIKGGVAGYQTAFVFFQLPHGLLAVSIARVVFTAMTESAVAGDSERFAEQLNRGLRTISFLILPAAAGYIAIAQPLIQLLLEHGLAGAASTQMVSTVLRAWAIGIFFFSMFYVQLRAFYALGDTRTPMIINAVAFAVNVAVDVVLFFTLPTPELKIAGLAVGHAVSYMIAATAGMVILRRRCGYGVTTKLASTVGRTSVAAAITGLCAWAVAQWLQGVVLGTGVAALTVQVTGATLTGLLVYVALSRILRVEELRWIARLVGRHS